MQDHLGTLEAGKIADMIAVEGNALDDVALLKDITNVKMVIQAGRVVKDVVTPTQIFGTW